MTILKNRSIAFLIVFMMSIGIWPTSAFAKETHDENMKKSILENCSVTLEKEGKFLEGDTPLVSIASSNVKEGASAITVDISGHIPDGSILIIQSYPKDETYKFGADGNGVFVANKSPLMDGVGQNISIVNTSNMTTDKKLIAVILNSGQVIAQSQPVEIISSHTSDPFDPFVLEFVDDIYEGDTSVALKVGYDDKITGGRLLLHQDDTNSSSPNLDHQIANVSLQKGENVKIRVSGENKLVAGKKIAASIYYCKPGTEDVYKYYTTKQITIQPKKTQAGISIVNTEFKKDSTFATVQINGCDEYIGGQLIICQYPSSQNEFDPDHPSTKRIYQTTFNKQGKNTYEFTQNTPLVAGNKVIAYLYKYDEATDHIKTKYSKAVSIISEGGEVVPSKVEIATSNVRVGDSSIWVTSDFDEISKNGRLIIYEYEGNEFNPSKSSNVILYSDAVSPSKNSKKVVFDSEKLPLKGGWNLKAALLLTDKGNYPNPEFKYSEPIQIQTAPVIKTPTVTINEKEITEGDTKMNVSVTYDKNIKSATYTVYEYEGETLNKEAPTTKILNLGIASKWTRFPINFLVDQRPLKPGSKIVVVLKVITDENKTIEYNSNVITVGARPDWETSTIALEAASIKTNAKSVPVTIRYNEGYHTLDEFYCNVTLYQYPANITDFDYEESYAERIGTLNGTVEKPIRGEGIEVPIMNHIELKEGYKLIAKLRLPHVEWEGEEVDYLSGFANIIGENTKETKAMVLLYQLGEDSARGSKVRQILKDLNIEVKTIEKSHINETIGYLAELDKYETANNPYNGDDYDTEFIIMSALSESKLDAFLYAMMEQNLRINHKAAVTDTNKDWTFKQLIGDIADEHEVFMALLELDKLVKKAQEFNKDGYDSEKWELFQEKLKGALDVLTSVEPALSDLQNAATNLKNAMLDLTGRIEMVGRVVLDCIQIEDTYTVKASVVGAPENATYTYLWSNGSRESYVTGMTLDDLLKLSVTVTGSDKFFGSLPKAHLKGANAVSSPSISAGNNTILLSWPKAENQENTPKVLEYIVDVFEGDTFVKTMRVSGDCNHINIDELKNDTTYTLKLYAVNVIGRSDIIMLTGKPKKSNSSSSSKSNRSSNHSSNEGSVNSKSIVNITESKVNNAVIATIKLEEKVNHNGSMVLSVSKDDITSAIQEAKKVGRSNKDFVVQLKVKTQSLDTMKVKLPIEVQKSLIDVDVKSLDIMSDNVSAKFDKESLKEIRKQAVGEVEMSVSKGTKLSLSNEAKAVLRDRPVYDFKLTRENKLNISDFGKGKVEIGIPYKLAKDEKANGIFMAYIDEKGNAHVVEGSYYDEKNKMAIGKADHFSVYGIGYKEVKENVKETIKAIDPSFIDTADHWAKDHIDFVVGKGILTGTSKNTFSPDLFMTRGMCVTALGRLNGVDISNYKTNSFTDVQKDSYYAAYVEWANEKGIVSGVGNSQFAPERPITREEMAVIMNNYAKVMGNTLPKSKEMVSFADEQNISTWAKEAVTQMQQAGIISGKNENKFVPKGTATRAEVSTVLRYFIELVMDKT
ncbi:DUF3783 domain-containing protein [Inediibacterium massiliense]|uniref:DUF3783 domain-containing protein n=1 Tax=Inediibacterium massiliense TaxID=1658111 RepID=UPI0006B56077|nr:DUF3783 domain-containing protein [Inediibacterium massiliense]